MHVQYCLKIQQAGLHAQTATWGGPKEVSSRSACMHEEAPIAHHYSTHAPSYSAQHPTYPCKNL